MFLHRVILSTHRLPHQQQNRYKRKLYLYSLLICVANIGMALGGLPEYLMDAVVEAGERRVLLLGGTLYYGAFTCLLFFFLQYFFEYLQLSGRERRGRLLHDRIAAAPHFGFPVDGRRLHGK